MMKTFTFPAFNGFFETLKVGHVGSSFKIEKDLNKKRVLIILDVTGSMNDSFDRISSRSTTKYTVALDIIKNLTREFKSVDLKFDILPFNDKPLDLLTYDYTDAFWETIPKPDSCTYFTPLVEGVNKLLLSFSNYVAVIFASDGLPSEDKHDALEALTIIGENLRSKEINTGSLAIGLDADGFGCAKFAGERGINMFINNTDMIPQVVSDMKIVIKNQYIIIDDKSIPVEVDGSYYYVDKAGSSDIVDLTEEIDLRIAKKFVDLLIIYESTQPSFNSSRIKDIKIYIGMIADLLIKEDKISFVNYYDTIIKKIEETQVTFQASNCLTSVVNQSYRIASQQY